MASGSASSVVVERGTTSVIKPASPTEPRCMFLAAMDIHFRWFHYATEVFFYKLDGPYTYEEGVEVLKASLAQVLVAYYPWAGRLVEQADGRLALHCNDAGVEFVEASVALPFSSLEGDNFQHRDFFKDFCTLTHIVEWTGPDLPLLSIQVTKFSRGEAMALGVSHSHVIADGISTFNFLKSWGEYARGLEMSLPPIHMREEFCIAKLIKPLVVKEGLSCAQGGRPLLTWIEPSFLTQYDFLFSSQTLKKLKHIARGQKPCSTFQALVAHIWKHVALAQDLIDSDEFGLSLIGDFRRRLIPPLPEAYFGNAIMRSFATTKMKDLKHESLSDTVRRVQDSIDSFTETNLRTFYGALELMPACDSIESLEVPTLLISGSTKFPIFDVEFGWGKPSCVRTPRIRGDGEAFMWMGKDQDGSIVVSFGTHYPYYGEIEARYKLPSCVVMNKYVLLFERCLKLTC